MAAPATTTRSTPGGIKLREGQGVLIAFSLDADVSFWEVSFDVPEYDGGDPVEHTTQHNSTYGTVRPRTLIRLGTITGTCTYDPDVYNQITSLINQEGSVTITFGDGSTLDMWAYLRRFKGNTMSEGNAPDAEFEIVVTNYDSTNNVEAGPVLTSAAGT